MESSGATDVPAAYKGVLGMHRPDLLENQVDLNAVCSLQVRNTNTQPGKDHAPFQIVSYDKFTTTVHHTVTGKKIYPPETLKSVLSSLSYHQQYLVAKNDNGRAADAARFKEASQRYRIAALHASGYSRDFDGEKHFLTTFGLASLPDTTKSGLERNGKEYPNGIAYLYNYARVLKEYHPGLSKQDFLQHLECRFWGNRAYFCALVQQPTAPAPDTPQQPILMNFSGASFSGTGYSVGGNHTTTNNDNSTTNIYNGATESTLRSIESGISGIIQSNEPTIEDKVEEPRGSGASSTNEDLDVPFESTTSLGPNESTIDGRSNFGNSTHADQFDGAEATNGQSEEEDDLASWIGDALDVEVGDVGDVDDLLPLLGDVDDLLPLLGDVDDLLPLLDSGDEGNFSSTSGIQRVSPAPSASYFGSVQYFSAVAEASPPDKGVVLTAGKRSFSPIVTSHASLSVSPLVRKGGSKDTMALSKGGGFDSPKGSSLGDVGAESILGMFGDGDDEEFFLPGIIPFEDEFVRAKEESQPLVETNGDNGVPGNVPRRSTREKKPTPPKDESCLTQEELAKQCAGAQD